MYQMVVQQDAPTDLSDPARELPRLIPRPR
jgi:hypothetical protein